jgi:hypothetical protein
LKQQCYISHIYFTASTDKPTLNQILSLVDILVVVVAPAMMAVMRGDGGRREQQGGRQRRQQQQQRQAWRWRRGGSLQGDWLWPLATSQKLQEGTMTMIGNYLP